MSTIDPPDLPPRDGDAPLHERTRDELAAFLYYVFDDAELLELLREAKVSVTGGYRLESLGPIDRADLLADEIRAVPSARAGAMAKLRAIYEFPALENVALPPVVAAELASLAVEPDASPRMLWRVLADPSAEVRATVAEPLGALADSLFGPPPAANGDPQDEPEAPPKPVAEPPDARALRKEADRAGQRAERALEKADSLKEQLRQARADASQHERDAAHRAKEIERLTRTLAQAQDKLAAARKKGGVDALEKLEKERGELANRVATLDEKLRDAVAARKLADEELASAKQQLDDKPRKPEPAHADEAEAPLEAVPTTWLFPRFTREFYDSLEKWDSRIQRTAFKRAMLLAENHRHPSLRAIPLEGLPGYYRVRIATDVRLIYRRSEDEREVELLSLIDREDLDRYVRQAKTR